MDAAPTNATVTATAPVIDMQNITTRFGSQAVHQDLNLQVLKGEILAIAGGSGSGKSVLLREMIKLQRPTSGTVQVLGDDLATLNAEQLQALRQRWGVMFQKGGLFSSLTVLENVGLPLREHSNLERTQIDGIAQWKLELTGLPPDTGAKMPNALSGGMLKRVALARAMALDPELLFLDEPTSGLDPASAAGLCELILSTHARYHPTIVIVSHNLDVLWQVCDRVAVLGEAQVLALGPMAELKDNPHPLVHSYFLQPRAQRPGEEDAWKTN